MQSIGKLLALLGTLEAAGAFSAPERPSLVVGPKTPETALPVSPPRDANRTCTVDPSVEDAGPELIRAAQECNDGGTVVLLPDVTYSINSPTDLTFLKSVDIAILGTVKFSEDIGYWQTHLFDYDYQDSHLFWRFGGEDVNIGYWQTHLFDYDYQDSHLFWRFGGEDVNIYGLGQGLIDGSGQLWWNAKRANESTHRPILLGTDGLKGGSISGLNMKNSPMWFNIIANSSDVLVTDINIWNEVTNSSSPPANTDGWDTYRSSNIIIQDSVIDNYDDCVSFKPNSTSVIIQNLVCNGSHGISVGSLGQYQGQYDIVEDLYVYNISMSNASNGARIKIWPGVPPNTTNSEKGGGEGYVRNVTYELFHNDKNDWAIELTQCYFADSQEACDLYPAVLVIEDIYFKDFYGTTSNDNDPQVGTLICSSPDVCKNIYATNINISPPSGNTAEWICTNMDESLLDINCVAEELA